MSTTMTKLILHAITAQAACLNLNSNYIPQNYF